MTMLTLRAAPTFCSIDVCGGKFWSRYAMIQSGIEKFRAYKATCIAQGMTEEQFAVGEFTAVINSQACTLFNAVPYGQA